MKNKGDIFQSNGPDGDKKRWKERVCLRIACGEEEEGRRQRLLKGRWPQAREHTVQRYSFKETGGDRELVWGHVQFEVLIKHSNIASWQLDIEPLSGKSFDMQI